MNVLITGGGCEEPIDNVRSICNFSTGRTAVTLAEYFVSKNCTVHCLLGKRALKTDKCKVTVFSDFTSLQNLIKEECSTGKYDLVIHAAAVSDYSPDKIIIDGKSYKAGSINKISSAGELLITLKRNPKIIDSIKEWCGKRTTVIAFKLTSNETITNREKAVNALFKSRFNEKQDGKVPEDCTSKLELMPDYVVSNDLSEISAEKHRCLIYAKPKSIESPAPLKAEASTVEELAAWFFETRNKSGFND